MIIESIIVGVTAITLGSLWYAVAIDRNSNVDIDEARRVLERDRTEWLRMTDAKYTIEQRRVATRQVAQIDKELLRLAGWKR